MTQETLHQRDTTGFNDSVSASPREITAARRALAVAFGPPERRGFAVRLWDGSMDGDAGTTSQFTFVVRRPGALRRALLPPSELSLVEAYLRDDLDIEGDLEAAGTIADVAARQLRSVGALSGLIDALRQLKTSAPMFDSERLWAIDRRKESARYGQTWIG